MNLLAMQRDMRAWLCMADDAAARRMGDADGLSVYQNNYRAQLVACLEDGFARTRDWIGEDAFARAAVTHIDDVPPSSWTLDAYVRDFPDTLARLYPDDPEIAEIAAIERGVDEIFVAPDASPVAAGDLANVDWDKAVLRLTPAIELLPVTTNAFFIWSALSEQGEPPGTMPLPVPATILIWRQDEMVQARQVDGDEQAAIILTRSGASFATMCEDSVERHGQEDGIARAGQMVGRWLADGLIVKVDGEIDS